MEATNRTDDHQMHLHRLNEGIDINRALATDVRSKGNNTLGDAYDAVYKAQLAFAAVLKGE